MAQINEDQLQQRMIERGVPEAVIANLQPSLRSWLGAFHDPIGSIRNVVLLAHKRSHPCGWLLLDLVH